MTTLDNGRVDGRPLADVPAWGTPGAPSTRPEGNPDAELLALDDDEGLRAGDEPPEVKQGPVDSHIVPLPAPTPVQKLQALREGERPPAAPAWITDSQVRREVLTRAARDTGYYTRRAAFRSPAVFGLLLWWTVRGAVTIAYRLGRWAMDVDGHPLVGDVRAKDDRAYVKMANDRTRRQKFRIGLLGAAAVLALVLLAVAWAVSTWALVGLAGLVLAELARAGKPEDRRLISPGVSQPARPRLTSQLIVRAMSSLPIAGLAKELEKDSTRIWRSQIAATRGGYRVHIQLPGSTVAAELVQHEQRLASALLRPEDTVIVEPLPHVTPGDLNLWIFDQPVLGADRGPGPLAKARKASWWTPVQLGLTRLGRSHAEPLRGGAWFVGGRPSSGKSSLCRLAAAHTALDPHALLVVVNLKGSPDYLALKAVAHKYISGSPETDRTVLPQTVALLRWLLAECGRRNDYLVDLVAKGKADSNDVTPELAQRYPRLRPMTVILDEVHRLIDRADNPEAAQAEELLAKVIKAVRSVAITLICATQLAGVESIPPALTRAARLRGCLVVSDSTSFRQIFGDAGRGVFAELGVAKLSPGSVLLRSESGAPVKVGCFELKPAHLRAIGERALKLRTALHTLTGEAAGEVVEGAPDVRPAQLLEHVLDVLSEAAPVGDQTAAWTGGPDGLEATLGRRFLTAYGDRADGWLTGELKARGVTTEVIGRRWTEDGEPRQRSVTGVRAAEVRRALEIMLSDERPQL